jgi:hypothetical protein
MATIALATSHKSPSEVGNSESRYQICAGLAANTSAATTYYTVPGDGVITAAVVNAAVTSDATKTYTYVIANVTANKTVTAASQLYDASPVLTAGTPASLTLSTTAADVAVTKGDVLSIAFTGGTGSGVTSVIIDVQIVA